MIYDCSDPVDRRDGMDAAVRELSAGRLAVIPTDTVYGIAADAFTPSAVTALLGAKGRGRDLPTPVLVGSWEGLDGLVMQLPQPARILMEAFWPGGLTLVVRHSPSLDWDLGDAHGTVAVRMPLHAVALDLLARTGPLAVSSANRSGQQAATSASGAELQLGATVGVYLDGGESPSTVASSIVDVTGDQPRVLREGVLSTDELRAVLPTLLGPS